MSAAISLPDIPRVALFGAGTVGTAVTILLQKAGCDVVGVWSRTPASAARAAERLGVLVIPDRGVVGADLVLIGAGDGAIASVVEDLAGRIEPGAAVAHFAGSLGVEPLRTAIEAGARGLAIHPVQTCPDVESAIEALPGSAWGVTSSDADTGRWATALIRDRLQGYPVEVAEEARPPWHAASVMTSNGISALLSFGESLLQEIGIAEPSKVLGPLAAASVANATRNGGAETLTGPIVRGDAATIERHLIALRTTAPELLDGYIRVVEVILSAARKAGRLDAAAAAEIERLFR